MVAVAIDVMAEVVDHVPGPIVPMLYVLMDIKMITVFVQMLGTGRAGQY